MNHLRIIIVEDEALVARDLQTTLVRLGYAVVKVVGSGTEAIAAVQASKPDLAIMSVGLTHDESGTSMARILQQKYDVPVVIISAHGDPRTLQRARDSQPFGYLLKPFHESELRTVVELAVARHQAQQRLVSHQSHLTATLRSLPEAVLATDLLGTSDFHERTCRAPHRLDAGGSAESSIERGHGALSRCWGRSGILLRRQHQWPPHHFNKAG